jgi:hypothetical protein
MTCSTRIGFAAAACLVAGLAHAQVQTQPHPQVKPRPAAADPLDAQAAVPPAVHASALARYKPAGDLSVTSWREANDTVARVGGWKAYAREAQGLAPGAALATPAAPAGPASHPPSGKGPHGHP